MKICWRVVSRTAQLGKWLRVYSLVDIWDFGIVTDIACGQTIEVVEVEEIIDPE
jgi:hypothetical protein